MKIVRVKIFDSFWLKLGLIRSLAFCLIKNFVLWKSVRVIVSCQYQIQSHQGKGSKRQSQKKSVSGRAAENAESARSAIYAIFRLIARILSFRNKKYRILMFCDKKYRILMFCNKTELYLTVLQQTILRLLKM